ncbi:MAG: ribosomal-processing cysteine protease Prp [Phascolarctobacterium sp.]|nr:ribosomal-processing cysteine protease Prp [Phascolarctobacterium sp.]
MIIIDLFKSYNEMITGYKVSGHAEASEVEEYTMICNSISVLTQTPVIGLERHLRRKPSYRVNEENGVLEVALIDVPDDLTQTLFMTMVYGLNDLAKKYPQYIRIRKHRR